MAPHGRHFGPWIVTSLAATQFLLISPIKWQEEICGRLARRKLTFRGQLRLHVAGKITSSNTLNIEAGVKKGKQIMFCKLEWTDNMECHKKWIQAAILSQIARFPSSCIAKWYSIVYIYHISLSHSSTDELLSCFHISVLINYAALNMGVIYIFWVNVFTFFK